MQQKLKKPRKKTGGKPSFILSLVAASLIATIAACGGGDSGNGGGSENRTPVMTSGSSASLNENLTDTGYRATASDADNDNLTFSISGGVDSAHFNINATSGALSFNNAPDFEAPNDSNADNTYELTVSVSDGSASSSLALSIEVLDQLPVFSSTNSFVVEENSTETQYTAMASDVVSYNLSGGADQSLFSIDQTTGVLLFSQPVDYDVPTDSDSDNEYLVEISATDGSNIATQLVSIEVTNLNDISPVFSSSDSVTIAENYYTNFYTALASDQENDTISYSLFGGVDSSLFIIDTTTGQLSFITAPDFESPGDADQNNQYLVTIQATDSVNSVSLALTITLTTADLDAPTTNITFPPLLSSTEGETIVVRGTAQDASPISSIMVNGVAATTTDNFANWQAEIPLSLGENILTVATDDAISNGNQESSTAQINRDIFIVAPTSLVLDQTNSRVLIADRFLNSVIALDITDGSKQYLYDGQLSSADFDGIAIDTSNNQVLLTDSNELSLGSVNLSSGEFSIISNNSIPNTNNPFVNPISVDVDSGNNRALVLDQALKAVLAVNLVTGERSVLSDNTTPDNEVVLDDLRDIIVDVANNRALVLQSDNVTAVNLTTGQTTIVTDNTLFSDFALLEAQGITLDAGNDRALVSNSTTAEIIAVDLMNGNRSIFTDGNRANALLGNPIDIVFDSSNNRALVVSSVFNSVIAVESNTGLQSLFSGNHTPSVDYRISSPTDFTFDQQNNRLLVTDAGQKAVLAVDSNTGERSIVSNDTTPSNSNPLFYPNGIVFDTINQRAIVSDPQADSVLTVNLTTGQRDILHNISPFVAIALDSDNNRVLLSNTEAVEVAEIDLTDGSRGTFSSNSLPDSLIPFSQPGRLVVDQNNDRTLLLDTELNALMSIDLTSGQRTIFSDAISPNDVNSFQEVKGIDIEHGNQRALVTDSFLDALIAVDLTSGEREILSQVETGNTANAMWQPESIAVDSVNNRAYVIDPRLKAIFAVDLANGHRVILSR